MWWQLWLMCDALEALLYNLSMLIYGTAMNATAVTVPCNTAQWKTGIPQSRNSHLCVSPFHLLLSNCFLGNIRYLIQVKYGHCFRNLKFQSLWCYHRMVRYRKQMLCICCRREIKVNFSLMNRTQNLMWNHQKPLNLSKECMNSQQTISRCT